MATLIDQKGGMIYRLENDQTEDDKQLVEMRFTIELPAKISVSKLCEEIINISGVMAIQTDEKWYEKDHD